MKAADFAIRHPAIIGILLISLALFGILSFRGMNRDLLANITTPEILIMTVYPGASPEVVEREVTNPLEKEFSLIQGIEKLSSNSHDGYSLIFATAAWGTDLEAKKNDIRDRINNASSELPEGIDGLPRLYELGTSSLPVYTCLIESDLSDGDLARILEDDIVPRLSRISDVSAVYARGVESPSLRVRLNPARLESLDVTALEAYSAVSLGQAAVPAGDVQMGPDRLAFQTDGEYSGAASVGKQPVGYTGTGLPVYLEDVADIYEAFANPEFRVSSGGIRKVALDVMKRPGGDTEALVAEVRNLQAQIEQESRGGIRFMTVLDNAGTIAITLSSVSRSAWFGGLLAVLMLLLFLHDIRAALIVSLSIPFTVFLTFILMRSRGMTLNIMTLAGITVSIGMIVDSSIVILENTMRHRRMGLDGREAASLGASEVGAAILASTSTSLSVFIPVLFVSGLAGAILKEVSWVLVFALSSSALTAIFIVPWLASRILDYRHREGFLERFGKSFDVVFDRIAGGYSRGLNLALDRKPLIAGFSLALVVLSLILLFSLGGEMFSAPDMNEFEVEVSLPPGYNLEKAEKKIAEIASLVRNEIPEIEADLWYVGLSDSATIVDSGNPSTGYGRIRLKRAATRHRSVFDIVSRLNLLLPSSIPDAEITVKNGGLAKQMDYATDGAGFRVELSGPDWNAVLDAAESLRLLMEDDPLIFKASFGVRLDRELMVLNLDRRDTGRLAVDPVRAGMNLRILFNGENAGTVESSGENMPIYIDSSLSEGVFPRGLLGRIHIRNRAGNTVPYSAFSSLERRESTDRIPHIDRLPSLTVVGELTENNLSGVQARMLPKLNSMTLPEGVGWRIVGAADVMGDTFRELARALGIAIFLVYAVMVIQFERFTQPLIIMGAVPFVLIGVSLSLAVFGSRITMMTFFGIIALGGMVVNNAIVLVEFTNQRREEGFSVRDSVLEAARIRLKPILITTLTTLLGLVPLAFALGEGSEIYAPLGQVIGGGLVTSTLITLILVPVLYEALEVRREKRAARRQTGKQSLPGGGILPLVLAVGFLAAGPGIPSAWAWDSAENGAPWTCEKLTDLALEDDPELRIARDDVFAARAGIQGARAERGPVLNLELGASYLSDPLISVPAGALGEFPDSLGPPLGGMQFPEEDTDVIGKAHDFRYDVSAVLEQPLFTWGKISSGVKIAEAGGAAARWNVAAREDELRAGLRIACESLELLGRMKEIVEAQRLLGNRLTELTLGNFEEGLLLESEYSETRNRVQQILLTSSILDKQEKDLILTVERATGLSNLDVSDFSLSPVDDSLESYTLPDRENLIASAMEQNSGLASLRSLEKVAESELDFARGNASFKPDIAFRTEFGYGGGFDRVPDDINGAWHLTLGARTTLVDSGRARWDIRGAEALNDSARLRSEQGRRELDSFIRSSLHTMGLNRENIRYFIALRDTDAARSRDKEVSWNAGYGREEEWLLAELDRLAAELQRLREVLAYLRLDRQVRAAAGILE